jgi:colicin import membrane protein
MAATAATFTKHERPRQPRRTKGKVPALILAIAVQLGFLAVLVFSVQWQNRRPEPVTAELYAPPVKAPAPVVEPPPPPAPKIEPQPAPPPKPEPVVEKPDPHAAEIALKAKQEQERKQREEIERRAREAKEAEDRRRLEDKQKAEAKERLLRQQQELAAMRAQLEREQEMRAQADKEQRARAAQQVAEASARSKSEADWIRRIQAKVKGNVIVPADLAGNPEAIFEVVQLPTGEIIEATLRKSSGSRAYDDAVQRAIIKSSPLPRPDRAELFQRTLTLKFRPQD